MNESHYRVYASALPCPALPSHWVPNKQQTNPSMASSKSPVAYLTRKLLGHSDDTRKSTAGYIRRAHHAGSWYSQSRSELSRELSQNLLNATADDTSFATPGLGTPRGIVSPHAGYSYSGPTAAYAYLALREALATHFSVGPGSDQPRSFTVVVLHPSHHVYLNGAAVSGAAEIETPIRNIPIDDELRTELQRTGQFSTMAKIVDEEEHSGEMQYPYIAQVIKEATSSSLAGSSDIRILPIMIGANGAGEEENIGSLLAPFLSRSNCFTVVSSDFCHWGRRFRYQPHEGTSPDGEAHNEIADYIEWLDRQGMSRIEMQQPGAFADYLRETSNTICGRHPITVWLHAIAANSKSNAEILDVKFVRYAQSSRVNDHSESSVSYASAVARLC